MSAFDDEFGLFGDEEPGEDEERKPTLGARQIASGETVIDDIEPEDERPVRRGPRTPGARDDRGPRERGPRSTLDPAVGQARAVGLLEFLAQKLVSKPDEVIVEQVPSDKGPLIELEVHPDDFGKVIGKGGRVAQALRTLVRASAEGRVMVDIVDVEDDDELEADIEHAPPSEATSSGEADGAETEEDPEHGKA